MLRILPRLLGLTIGLMFFVFFVEGTPGPSKSDSSTPQMSDFDLESWKTLKFPNYYAYFIF